MRGLTGSPGFDRTARSLRAAEKGAVPLDDRPAERIALVYPNRYAVGMASLGFQTVYRLFNEQPGIRCERVFIPQPPLDSEIRALESGDPLRKFSVIGVSLACETDLLRLVRLLSDAGIPPLASERSDAHPLLLVGGVLGGLNPSPLLPFADAILAGEGEGVIPAVSEALLSVRPGPNWKRGRLDALGGIPGIFRPRMDRFVERQVAHPLEQYPTYTPVCTPLSHFGDLFVVELTRGCGRGCLFCAGGKLYQPLRRHSPESVLDTVRRRNPGVRRVGLEGASLSDYAGLEPLAESLVEEGHEVSFSSVRVDRITPQLVAVLEKSRVRSFTMAPEAGTEALRGRIGKPLPDAVLTEAIRSLAESPVETLKLYFLIGLPGETDTDVSAVSELVRRAASLFLTSPRRRLRLSVNAFVPKPFTEFQWSAMADGRTLERRRGLIASGLRGLRNVVFSEKSGREELLQGILATGGPEAGMAAHDRVVLGLSWKKALERNGIDPERSLHADRDPGAPLPWDFVRSGVSKGRLLERLRVWTGGPDAAGEESTVRTGSGPVPPGVSGAPEPAASEKPEVR
ncbi:MAG: radical SAM protein [bacterium]|nr:radical SAM protein [bacterium]